MELSIILLNYRSTGLLKQCLQGIIASQPELEYELIVVDNASGDGCLAMVRDMMTPEYFRKTEIKLDRQLVLPSYKLIQSEVNGGFGAGHNLGIKAAQGEFILTVNPDIAMMPGVIEMMVAYMRQYPVGMIGPRLINPDGSIQYSCRRYPNSLIPIFRRTVFGRLPFAKNMVDDYLMVDSDHRKTMEVDWLFGACLLIRKSVLDEVGMFDERFFMYFEDLDLCRRFWEKGHKVVYLAEAQLVHYHARFSAEKEGVLGIFSPGGRIHLYSGLKYFLKYFGKKPPR